MKQLSDQIYEIIWYGSTAHGDAEEGSDVDVAISCPKEDFLTQQRIGSIASEVGLEQGVLLTHKLSPVNDITVNLVGNHIMLKIYKK